MIQIWSEAQTTSSFETPNIGDQAHSAQVCVSVGEILPTLANAFQNGFQWVHDFADDQVTIPSDLMELIQLAKQAEAGGRA